VNLPCCMWPAVSNNRERCDRFSDTPLARCFSGFATRSGEERLPEAWLVSFVAACSLTCWNSRDAEMMDSTRLEEQE